MFLKKGEITDKVLDEKIHSHYKQSNKYLATYLIPEYTAYFIANGYYNSYMFEQSFDIIIETCIEHINVNIKITKKLKKDIKDLLEIKYGLSVESEDPLSFKKND